MKGLRTADSSRPVIAVMQPAHAPPANHCTPFQGACPASQRLLVQPEVRSVVATIGNVLGEESLQMALIQGNHVRRGHLVVATRDDLVGQYVGHTAPKTKEVLKKAMGGVLFIDEAYYLYRPENERDYGPEAIEILLQVMENQREDLVIILAGYKERMETFFQYNPGFHSRIAHHIDFPDYTLEELLAIAELMVGRQRYAFDEESRQAFAEYLQLRIKQPHFANARSVRNAIDRIKLRQANRLVKGGGSIPKAELIRIDAADIHQSRVFQRSLATECEAPPARKERP